MQYVAIAVVVTTVLFIALGIHWLLAAYVFTPLIEQISGSDVSVWLVFVAQLVLTGFFAVRVKRS